jgi:hypothetical protein
MYDEELGRWTTMDPMAEKVYEITPYRYGFNNPVRFRDVNGMLEVVKPKDEISFEMIKNTLRPEDKKYIKIDKNGDIDRSLINSHKSISGNYNNLKEMVNSQQIVEISVNDQFYYVDKNGDLKNSTMTYIPYDSQFSYKDLNGNTMGGTTTGESGFMGKTLFPDREGGQNSPDKTIKVIINKNLSIPAKAEMYSHEANGHALLYIRNGGNHKGASHQVVNENGQLVDQNLILKNMIIESKRETIINMRK